MTSVAVPVQFAQTTEIFETTVYETADDEHLEDEDTEMTDASAQEYQEQENEYDDQEMYNAEVGSTIVEPPQSDAVHTHAPSTILDEMEYLEEVDYEEQDPTQKDSNDIHLVHETASYKPETTTAHTPPAVSSSEDNQLHPPFLNSPASRLNINPLARPATPILSNLTITTTGEEDQQDDDWPICLYAPNGQEYMLFRSDGDTEALFEDNWLKSQPLETLFSSIRQTLENELASITSSFAMDEIVLGVSELDVSIAEDNCYTREISLQDLVNLINSLCARNGTERGTTCRLQLSLQPRFIARFNQLVSLTSLSLDAAQKTEDQQGVEQDFQQTEDVAEDESGELEQHVDETEQVDDFHGDDEQVEEAREEAPEEEYEEYEGDEGNENDEQPEYHEEETAEAQEQNPDVHEEVTADEVVDFAEAPDTQAGELEQAEEDELYEENDENEESYNPAEEPTETLVNEEDVDEEGEDEEEELNLVEPFEETTEDTQNYDEQEEHQGYDEEAQPEENPDREQEHADTANPDDDTFDESGPKSIASEFYWSLTSSDEEEENDDDLISYEEAVDQTEDGQDYRQQYLNEAQEDHQNGEATNGHIPNDEGNPLNGISDETLAEEPISGTDSPASKRPLNQVVDLSAEDQAPRKRPRIEFWIDDVASKRAKS